MINTNTSTTTHCFPSATIGLRKHGPITIDPTQLPDRKTLVDFRGRLKNIHMGSGDRTPAGHMESSISALKPKPSLMLVARRGNVSRVMLNQDEIIKVAKEVGFKVSLLEASGDNKSMADDYKQVHTSHALWWVPTGLGTEWASRTYYGEKTSRVLGLEYMEYKAEANESSLSDKYGSESLVVKNQEGFHGGKWSKRDIF
ncbi:alpha-1,3-arabinosyltransferase XAT3-like [Neltuma alba]|uniref:alpha-1,3-arabinosyltransferase XAT3-like n=1 Tax=Neltuma alba TaxID=207710 RepID=UPI0010A4D26A|nr:alpha-1,3-arabinosyltransferase XAT3-like [Prosopis alba]